MPELSQSYFGPVEEAGGGEEFAADYGEAEEDGGEAGAGEGGEAADSQDEPDDDGEDSSDDVALLVLAIGGCSDP